MIIHKRWLKNIIFSCGLFSARSVGDEEFERIVQILMRSEILPEEQPDDQWPKLLAPGLFLFSPDTVCLCHTSAQQKWDDQHPIFSRLKEKPDLPSVKRLFVATRATRQKVPEPFSRFVASMQEWFFPETLLVWLDRDAIRERVLAIPPLGLRYCPGGMADGVQQSQSLERKAKDAYNVEFDKLFGKINFVGMSVYKEEATSSVDMEHIYIPLGLLPEGATEEQSERTNPLTLLAPGSRHVVLGDPGSGKSTLLRFLAMAGRHHALIKRYNAQADDRLPIMIVLRQYADALRANPQQDLLDYLVDAAFRLLGVTVDRLFFEYFLLGGKTLLMLDGIDELPDTTFKQTVRKQVGAFLNRYPGNTVILSSRIVGYEKDARYDGLGFSHHQVAPLTDAQIEKFIHDWYAVKIDNKNDRTNHANDLSRVINDADNQAIHDLARNPLLLTIICLVHRIDAVLPDERVVLYSKCAETLLNTWHAWKFRSNEGLRRSKVERRNRSRIEAIAYWMHSGMEGRESTRRAVVPYEELVDFLSAYIETIETPQEGSPQEMAEEFLHFVQKRSGLLIEVWDRQFSFVHLTFQEYLAATHLRKSGEEGGLKVIWETIQDRCGDDRWHEVIRLLIGALEQKSSQARLLERILPPRNQPSCVPRALLVGGCLVDSIEATEELEEEIVRTLLLSAAQADSVGLRKLLKQLSVWQKRAENNRARLGEWVADLLVGGQSGLLQESVAINLLSLGWSTDEIHAATGFPSDLGSPLP